MAFRLTKDEIKERDGLVTALNEASASFNDAITSYNAAAEQAWSVVNEAQEAYNKAVRDAQQFIEDVHEERETEFEEQTEKWQEGAKGQAASAWLEEWTLVIDEADMEAPEPLDPPDMELGNQLNELPEKVE